MTYIVSAEGSSGLLIIEEVMLAILLEDSDEFAVLTIYTHLYRSTPKNKLFVISAIEGAPIVDGRIVVSDIPRTIPRLDNNWTYMELSPYSSLVEGCTETVPCAHTTGNTGRRLYCMPNIRDIISGALPDSNILDECIIFFRVLSAWLGRIKLAERLISRPIEFSLFVKVMKFFGDSEIDGALLFKPAKSEDVFSLIFPIMTIREERDRAAAFAKKAEQAGPYWKALSSIYISAEKE